MKEYSKEDVVELFNEFSNRYPELNKTDYLKEKGLIKEEFKVGELYSHTFSGAIVNYQGVTSGYGVNDDGCWIDLGNNWTFTSYPECWTKATESQKEKFKKALYIESDRKGFKENIIINNSNLGYADEPQLIIRRENWIGLNYDKSSNEDEFALALNGLTIFKAGKWAEIIKEEIAKDVTMEEVQEKFGCKVKIVDKK
jgi:hypothetical protein